jgi:acetyl esterase
VLGALDQSDWLCSNVAAAVHCVVVSVDYRLAPAHRWPAAEDCYAVLVDIAGRADGWLADPQRLAVMGDSAGGNLAAVVSLMARDRCGPLIGFQALLYPATDLTCSSPSIDENADAPILTRDDVMTFRSHYLGTRIRASRMPPRCSPLITAGCRRPWCR